MRNRDLILEWLARIRVAGVEAVAEAIGISERRVRGHGERLEAEGFLVRHRMDDGGGAVLVVTARGVRAAGYAANSRSTTSSTPGLLHGRGVDRRSLRAQWAPLARAGGAAGGGLADAGAAAPAQQPREPHAGLGLHPRRRGALGRGVRADPEGTRAAGADPRGLSGRRDPWPGERRVPGVATFLFAVSWSESITRSTSSKLRPVVIG